ncbi:hypothetical protein NE237_006744 [Protea cynaroides]|uniref:Uncharacterized protein n=1 Tax=Protea cynaroides TaxID=273540 RepID=A0A9Q0QVG3_9MAGN|nr:hypothetical protein NE237_006744 [Protea cynaroides]
MRTGIGDAASTAGWPPRGNAVIQRLTLEGSVPDLKRFRTPQLLHSKSSGIWFWFSKSSGIWFWFSKSSGICLWFRRNSDLQEESSAMEDQTLETVFEKCDVISVHTSSWYELLPIYHFSVINGLTKSNLGDVSDQGQENNNIGKNDIVSNQVCEISSDQEWNLPILQKIDALSTKIQDWVLIVRLHLC